MTTPDTTPRSTGSGRGTVIALFVIGGAVALVAILGTFFATRGATSAAGLDGTTWTATSMTVDGTEQPLDSGSTLTLTFSDGRVGASAGCNQQHAEAASSNGQLTVTSPMASTMMACEQALMDQDQAIAAFLTANPTYVMYGDALTLTAGSTSIALQSSK